MKRSFILQAVLFFIVVCAPSLSHASGIPAAPDRIEITAKRFAYAPAEITLKKGVPVVLALRSIDVAHGLRCSELNLDIKVNKGATGEARLTPDKAGTFIAHCAVFCGSGHGRMTLTIRVVD